MGSHLRFLALVLVVCLCVQHVQIKRIEDQQRAEWQRLLVEMDALEAHAVLPVALAAAAPYVLNALVAGTTFFWCYTHGGKEAWIQFTGAVKDGVSVTKDWVQKRIAELHGISTDGDVDPLYFGDAANVPYPLTVSSGQRFNYGGETYFVSHIIRETWVSNSAVSPYEIGYLQFMLPTSYLSPNAASPTNPGGCTVCRKGYMISVTESPNFIEPSLPFNPADHPELYNDQNLLTNCHAVAKAHPDLKLSYMTSPTKPAGATDANTKNIPLAAVTAAGSLVDEHGNVSPSPFEPGWLAESAGLTLPELDEERSGMVPVGDQTVAVGQTVADRLTGAGINGPITGVGGDWITWTDEAGHNYTTRVSKDVVAAAQQAVAGAKAANPSISVSYPGLSAVPAATAATDGAVINPTDSEQDPGDPKDPDFGAPPVFDTNFDWGQNETFDINAHVSVIENLPIVNLVKGSSLKLVNADSVISIHLASWPGGPVDLSVDFDQWSSIWTVMGAMIYFIALLNSISLAILGHKI